MRGKASLGRPAAGAGRLAAEAGGKAEGGKGKGERKERRKGEVELWHQPGIHLPLPPSLSSPPLPLRKIPLAALRALAGGNRRRGRRAAALHPQQRDTRRVGTQRPAHARKNCLTIKGIGPVKAERYGITLLEIVAAAEGTRKKNRGTAGGRFAICRWRPRTRRLPRLFSALLSRLASSRIYWTWRLLAAGFSLDECAAIRGLSRETVQEHAERAKEEFEDRDQ